MMTKNGGDCFSSVMILRVEFRESYCLSHGMSGKKEFSIKQQSERINVCLVIESSKNRL